MHNLVQIASDKQIPRCQVCQCKLGPGGACPSSAHLPNQRSELGAKLQGHLGNVPGHLLLPRKLLCREGSIQACDRGVVPAVKLPLRRNLPGILHRTLGSQFWRKGVGFKGDPCSGSIANGNTPTTHVYRRQSYNECLMRI